MRFLLLIIGMTLSHSVLAHDLILPNQGVYSYSGSFQVIQKLTFETVHAMNESGRGRLKILQKQGFECQFKIRDTYLCKKSQTIDGSDPILKQRVEATLKQRILKFGTLRNEPTIISEDEGQTEFRIPQEVTFDDGVYDFYRFLQRSDGSESFILGSSTESVTFVMRNHQIYFPLKISITESQFIYSNYIVFSEFSLQNRH